MEIRFGFGANWARYLDEHFSEERAEIARKWLLEFCGLPDLHGLSFIDIGCGSGLHSLGAWRSGVKSLLSFDYDPLSVASTQSLHQQQGAPENWQVRQGSILDDDLCRSLGTFDMVYSWGVLHHTGDQWKAISNAISLMGPRSRLYIALYTSDQFDDPPPSYWLDVKRRYNQAGWLRKRLMEAHYVWRTICAGRLDQLLRLPATARAYKADRGMAMMTDVRDWLGGWPMEFTSIREVVDTLNGRGLALVNIKTGAANTEYLFVPEAAVAELGYEVIAREQIGVFLCKPVKKLEDLEGRKEVFVFGTARGAALLRKAFERDNGPRIAGFIDLESSGSLDGIPVHAFDDFAAQFPKDTPVVLSNQHVQENSARLVRHGFEVLYNAHPMVIRLFREGL
ncbi:MAG TPA: class I SAM-dependent methyltransferase [Magnetospirillum sp.]|nr:class I SAM-dependent methyltransferase [Magnetospirillum sp.]